MTVSRGWPAPAKLNLMLHITGRREDGYHLLQTVFQFIDYSDELSFEVTQSGDIHQLTPISGVDAEDDLIIRAARLLQQHSGCSQGAAISIEKRLPMGGGLGGGSSDAATALVALNHLWGVGLPVDELAALGGQLGADVPVFVYGNTAWAEGVGDILQLIELPQPWYLVVKPPLEIATAKLFSDQELKRDCSPITIADFIAGDRLNVFTAVVKKRYPAVVEMMKLLDKFGDVRLTGTGACLFLSFERQQQATETARQIPQKWDSFIAQGLNRSPLYRRLDNA
ncbi:MAG TPA: 4-(cytidine 5'-diphospho)-2-C-methyl-D-erythritol kinase [Gammaproteobacteria bacterium]|nr:4-(cytidine 5'-diphospho)-2-C-methyl-D-erythritol kinase [Gammaproteobacteria bacterium]